MINNHQGKSWSKIQKLALNRGMCPLQDKPFQALGMESPAVFLFRLCYGMFHRVPQGAVPVGPSGHEGYHPFKIGP